MKDFSKIFLGSADRDSDRFFKAEDDDGPSNLKVTVNNLPPFLTFTQTSGTKKYAYFRISNSAPMIEGFYNVTFTITDEVHSYSEGMLMEYY